ncbi:MAG: DUF2231 domain-containing protein [Gemmatimonadales bacterium]
MTILGYDMPRLHAALNDFPAALLIAAVLFDFAALAWKRESLRWAALWTLWAGVVGGWLAVIAGELAEDALDHGEAIHELMEQHETQALVTMIAFTIVLGWKIYRRLNLSRVEEGIARAISVFGLVGIIWTGMIGGKLMFEHAAGIPNATLQAELQNRGAGHEHEPGEEHEPADSTMAGADSTKAAKGHVDPPGTPPHKH